MSELPQGWVEAFLGDLGVWSSGGTPSRRNKDYFGGDIPWVKTGDLRDTLVENIDETITESGLQNSSAKLFPAGTLLVAMYGATIGRTGLLKFPAATNQACAALLPSETNFELIPYLWWYLRANISKLRDLGQGGAQPNISQTLLKKFGVPIPPLNEQRRIVAKLDSLFERTRRARDELSHVPLLIEHYKQAILERAFRDAQLLSDAEIPLGDLTKEVRNGLSKKPADAPPGTPILRISAVRPFRVNLNDRRYYPLSETVTKAYLENGDLLFTRYNGNPDLVAVCGMVRDLSQPLVYPDKLIRVRFSGNDVSSEFVEMMCSAKQSRDWLRQYIKTAAGQHGIWVRT